MRQSPRTWPSIRFSRFKTDDLATARMASIYPYGVSVARRFDRFERAPTAPSEHWRRRSGLRHDRRSGKDAASLQPWRRNLLFLRRALPQQVRRRSAQVPLRGRRHRGTTRRSGYDLHLPYASRGSARQAGRLPDLRHGARTARTRRRSIEPGTARYEAPLLDRRGLGRADGRFGNGRPFARPEPAPLGGAAAFRLAPVSVHYSGGAVGRLAVSRARLGVGAQSRAEHVHLDIAGCR